MSPALAASLFRGTLVASRWRITLTIACIALGVALGGAVHTVHTSALAEIDRSARVLAGAADLEVRGPSSGFDDALFASIAALPELAASNPVVDVSVATVAGQGLRVLGIDAFRAVAMQPAFVASAASTGSGRVATLLDGDALWLSPAAAARLAIGAGAKLPLMATGGAREFVVAGVLPGLDNAGEVVVMDIAAAQQHFGRIGRLSRIDLRLRAGADPARAQAAVAALLPAGVLVSRAASISGRAAELTRAYRVNLDALALVALATGAFLVFSTLALQAARRRQEFALLRALGVTRGGITAMLAMEGAALGATGAVIGTMLGLAGSRLLLSGSGADLGAGYFSGQSGTFAPDALVLAGIALLGIGMSVAGAAWVARAVNRMHVSEALRDRTVELPGNPHSSGRLALLLAVAGVPLLFLPPIGGLPAAGYAAVALWLAAAIASVGPACRVALGLWSPQGTVASLALAQVRQLPGHLAASVAGIVVSASLCVAMVIMVFSFRVTLTDWLTGVVGADLYARAAPSGEAYFTADDSARIATLPGIASVEALRYDRLAIEGSVAPLSLVARPIDARILSGFQAEPREMPEPGTLPHVWISEAARDLHGWKAGERIELPIAGKKVPVQVAGVVRDYARTWGAVLIADGDYRRLTGDTRANDLAIHLAPQADPPRVQAAMRTALTHLPSLQIEEAGEIRRRSLEIFDRSFAVTYALEAVAIVIGLAGVTSSFAALAWSRKREFGVLRFLGLTRGEILRMIAAEGAAAGTLGAAIGLVAGAAISLVLLHVINRQSFHWSLELHWPLGALAILVAGIVGACALGARVSGTFAIRHEAILAVKDDA